MQDRIEHNNQAAPATEFSISNFFHDAYDKGIVKAVTEHPKEAVVTAVGAVALGAVLGKSLIKEEVAVKSMGPATEDLVAHGMPITSANRAAAADVEILNMKPWARSEAIRGGAAYAESRGFAATDALVTHSIPITAENRAMAATGEVLRMAPWERSAAIRGGLKYMEDRALTGIDTSSTSFLRQATTDSSTAVRGVASYPRELK